jgi:hypothetical protein
MNDKAACPTYPQKYALLIKEISVSIFISLMCLNGFLRSQERLGNNIQDGNIALNSQITGEILSDTNQYPISNATIQLYDTLTREVHGKTWSNLSGRFILENIKAGTYFINISHIAAYDHPVAITIEDGKKCDIGKQYIKRYPYVRDITLEESLTSPKDETIKKQPIDDGYPTIHNYKVLNVCDYLEMRAIQPLVYTNGVILIGDLVKTEYGDWLQQSCDKSIRTAGYIWSNAVSMTMQVNYRKSQRDSAILEEVEQYYASNILNEGKHPRVAVLGSLFTSDNLVVTPCNKEKTCGFGYGPMSAPAQIIYSDIRYINK